MNKNLPVTPKMTPAAPATTVSDTAARLDVRAALIRNSTVSASEGWRWDTETAPVPDSDRNGTAICVE